MFIYYVDLSMLLSWILEQKILKLLVEILKLSDVDSLSGLFISDFKEDEDGYYNSERTLTMQECHHSLHLLSCYIFLLWKELPSKGMLHSSIVRFHTPRQLIDSLKYILCIGSRKFFIFTTSVLSQQHAERCMSSVTQHLFLCNLNYWPSKTNVWVKQILTLLLYDFKKYILRRLKQHSHRERKKVTF